MAVFEEKTIEDAVTYRATGHIEIREATIVLRDGVEIARTYNRRVVEPGGATDVESAPTKALARLWTPDQIDRVRNAKAAALQAR
jgi:hypothetical protein